MQKDFWLEVFDPEIDFNPEVRNIPYNLHNSYSVMLRQNFH